MSLQAGEFTEIQFQYVRFSRTIYRKQSCAKALAPGSCGTLEHRGEETVGTMQVRPKLEIILHLEPDPTLFNHLARGPQRKSGAAQEILANTTEFFLKEAT